MNGIEQAPDIPFLEGIVPGLPPFVKDRRDEPIRANAHVTGTNDEIMRLEVLNGGGRVHNPRGSQNWQYT